MIQFKAKNLLALLPFRAEPFDPRFYLQGVHIEPLQGGGAVLVATNGHVMMCIRDAEAICKEPLTFTVTRDAAKFCRRRKGQPEPVVGINTITGRLTIIGGQAKDELYVQPGKCPLDMAGHSYPDWRKVVPRISELKLAVADAMQARYLALAAQVHTYAEPGLGYRPMRLWQARPDAVIAVEYEGAPDYMALIMPIRTSDSRAALDVWAVNFEQSPARAQGSRAAHTG